MFKKVSKFLLVLTLAVVVLSTTVMADTLIDAGNSPMDYELEVTVNVSGNGTVDEDGIANSDDFNDDYPGSVQLTANPASGWYFSHWVVGEVMHHEGTNPGDYAVTPSAGTYYGSTLTVSVSGTDNEGTDENPDGFVTVTAVFYEMEQEKEVTLYTYTGVGLGSTNPGSGGQSYAAGDLATATATPDSGWEFLYWAEWVEVGDGEVWPGPPISTENPFTFPIESDTELYAIFGEIQGNLVTTTQNIPGAGSTSHPGGVMVPNGGSVAISATASAGYLFSHWNLIGTGGGTFFSDVNAVTLTPVGDMLLEAVFVEEQEPGPGPQPEPEPEPEPEPQPEPEPEPEPIPDEPIPEDVPEVILDDVIPEDVPMPQTAGIPMEVASLFGGSLVALGTVIKRKRTK